MKELFTELAGRTLRFDGVSILHPSQVEDFLLRGLDVTQIRVSEISPEIEQFNQCVTEAEQLCLSAKEPVSFDLSWILPPEFLALNVQEHVLKVFEDRIPGLKYSDEELDQAVERVALELEEYQVRGLYDLLRVIIYILHVFKANNQIYGVGRGSSCASFILFLLGLHVVDSIKFEVPLEEFFHD